MITKSDMIHDHLIEIRDNDQLILSLRRNIDSMERSIRILTIENQDHRYRIQTLEQIE